MTAGQMCSSCFPQVRLGSYVYHFYVLCIFQNSTQETMIKIGIQSQMSLHYPQIYQLTLAPGLDDALY